MGMGSSMILSCDKVSLSYITDYDSTYENDINYGAHFDIHTNFFHVEYYIITKSSSNYTGSIEFRLSNNGVFKFNTLDEIECKYLTAFNSTNKIEFSFCNFVNNIVRGNIDNNPPCLIYFQKILSEISYCIFINNEYRERARIVAAYSTTSGNIRMIICFSDRYTVTENDRIVTVNCNLNYGNDLKINTISYVGLGPCL